MSVSWKQGLISYACTITVIINNLLIVCGLISFEQFLFSASWCHSSETIGRPRTAVKEQYAGGSRLVGMDL